MNNRRNYSKGRRVLKSVWGQMRPFEQMVLVLLDLPSGYIFVEFPQHEIIRLGKSE